MSKLKQLIAGRDGRCKIPHYMPKELSALSDFRYTGNDATC